MRRVLFLIAVAGVALAAASCGPSATSGQQGLAGPPGGGRGSGDPNPPGPTDASPGQVVFAAQNCTRCHSAPGAKASGRSKAPDLSKAGEKRDKTWLADHIRDAKKHNPMSSMPPYPEDKLSAKDLDTLSEFLAGLK